MKGHFMNVIVKKLMTFCLALCICIGGMIQMNVLTVQAAEEPVYKIRVNRAANCVTVYTLDENGEFTIPVKAFVCSCGRQGHGTPLGNYKTSDYYQWRLMVDGTYGRYAVRFNKKIMFHSVPYYSANAGDLEWEQFNLLGEPASLGCVRLSCDDVKWIYDNCKKGTAVEVYDDAENPGPLGKPEAIKIAAENPMRTWDPTDTGSENPWNQVKPSLYLTKNIGDNVLHLPLGATVYDIHNAVGVKDAAGVAYPLGQYGITISGDYDLNTAGVYGVHVSGMNAYGIKTDQDMVLCVDDSCIFYQLYQGGVNSGNKNAAN